MAHLCEYGCGQAATYFRKSSEKVPNGRWSCAPSPNSCPAKRNKTIGDKNPSRRPEVRKDISEKNSILFAAGSEYRRKCQKTLEERYGVSNPMKIPKVAKKVVAKRLVNNNYRFPDNINSPEAMKKKVATRIKNGIQIDPALLTPWQKYEREVDLLTSKNYEKHKSQINPGNLLRGRTKGTYQLDHVVSKFDGFMNNVSPEVIAHPKNLRMLESSENKKKHARSDMTIEELLLVVDSKSLS